jgi:hypothetical protein
MCLSHVAKVDKESRMSLRFGPLTIALSGPAVMAAAQHSRNDLQQIRTVVKFSAVRSLNTPPPPDTAWWGGSRLARKSVGPDSPFQASDKCCDSVAIRVVSGRCQLKSLLYKRCRRPLRRRKSSGDDPLGYGDDGLMKIGKRGRKTGATGFDSQRCGTVMCRLSALLKAIPSVCPAVEAPGFQGSEKLPPSEKSHVLKNIRSVTHLESADADNRRSK